VTLSDLAKYSMKHRAASLPQQSYLFLSLRKLRTLAQHSLQRRQQRFHGFCPVIGTHVPCPVPSANMDLPQESIIQLPLQKHRRTARGLKLSRSPLVIIIIIIIIIIFTCIY